MENLNRFQKILFTIFGIFAALGQIVGMYLLFIIVAMIIKSWTFGVISCLVILAMDAYRHILLKKEGYKPYIGQYKKEENA